MGIIGNLKASFKHVAKRQRLQVSQGWSLQVSRVGIHSTSYYSTIPDLFFIRERTIKAQHDYDALKF